MIENNKIFINKSYCILIVCLFITMTLVGSITVKSNSLLDIDGNIEIFIETEYESPEIITKVGGDSIVLSGLNNYYQAGMPIIPFDSVRILLQHGEVLNEVIVHPGTEIFLDGTFDIKNAQKPIPTGGLTESIESASGIITVHYPTETHETVGIENYRGYSILILNLFPVRCHPNGRISYFETLEISISTKTSDEKTDDILFRGLARDRDNLLELVDDSSVLCSYTEAPEVTSSKAETDDFVIITDASFISEFQPFVDWKNSVGINTVIKTIQDIETGYSGADLQEKVRNFVKESYATRGTEYVLLGGDVEIIPHRGLYGFVNSASGPMEDFDIPADLYYGALDGTWDDDNDGIWGEFGEEDLFAEVYIGRTPVSDSAEVKTFVEKTIAYENRSCGTNYHTETLLIGEQFDDVPTWGGDYNDALESLFPAGYNITKLYERDSTFSRDAVINEVNEGKHIVNNIGHGNLGYVAGLFRGNIPSLTNDNYYLWHSQGCYVASFDNRYDFGGYSADDCIAEKMVTSSVGGAVSFIGNSRYGWYYPGMIGGPSQRANSELFDVLFNENIVNLGRSLQTAKENMAGTVGSTGSYRWVYFSLNLLGDPTLKVGGYFSSPPMNLLAEPGDSYVDLIWEHPAEDFEAITNYKIYRGTTSGEETYLTTVGNVLNYKDTSAINFLTYYYQVSAVNADGEGPLSNEASATPGVPTSPLGLQAEPGDSIVYLVWSPPAFDGDFPITNYNVYRGTTSGGETYLTTIGNVLNYNDAAVTNGQTYYYQVSAFSTLIEGPSSNEANATPGVSSVPLFLQAEGGDSNISLTWNAPLYDGGFQITNYKIYRGTSSGGETYFTTVGNVLNYSDTAVIPEQLYYYQVSAVNSFSEGHLSNEAWAASTSTVWPMFGRNKRHTGLSPFDTSKNDLTLRWSFFTGDVVTSSPAIGRNGTIYVGSWTGGLYAVSRGGSVEWIYNTSDMIDYSSPAIGSDGTIYIGSMDKNLHAINPDGTMKWAFRTTKIITSSPTVGENGTIYFGSENKMLYAINPDGTLKWNYRTKGIIDTSPAIGADGTIYFGSNGNSNILYALNPDGTLKWNNALDTAVGNPVIDKNGIIYTTSEYYIYALNQDGAIKWSYPARPRGSTVSIGVDGTIYCGGDLLYALNPDGTMKWEYDTGSITLYSSPVIGGDGTIFIGSGNNVVAANPNGTLKCSYATGDSVHSSLAIDIDGTVYVGSLDGKLYALGDSSYTTPVQNIDTEEYFDHIQTAIDDSDTVDGHTITVAAGTYYENLVVNKGVTIKGENRDTTIINGSGINKVVFITASNVKMNGFTVTGSGPNWFDSGISLYHASYYCNISHNRLAGNYAGINMEIGSGYATVFDNKIVGNIVGIRTESSNNIIIGNNLSNNNEYGIFLSYASNNTVSSNHVSLNKQHGMYIYFSSSDNVIVNNTITDNADWGIYVHMGSDRNTVTGNTVNNNRNGIRIEGNNNGGVNCEYTYGNIVTGNMVFDNDRNGIYLFLAQNSTVTGCTAHHNERIGVYNGKGINNKISNNVIFSNTIWGLFIIWSEHCSIYNNTISSNDYGIFFRVSNNNTCSNNTLILNTWGLYIETPSSNNTIYHNNFLDNLNQAYDDCINFWDNGYPSGGNYWNDYTGLDIYSGPGQDIFGYDGIGDTAYTSATGQGIKGGSNQDNYPLWNLTMIIDHIIITPDPANIVVGGSQQFTAIAYDSYNNVIPGVLFTWSTDAGVVNQTGHFTAQAMPGNGYVTALFGSVNGSAVVTISVGLIDHITINPDPASVAVGGSLQFIATAQDVYNNSISGVELIWNTNAGVVNSTGYFTAQTMPMNGWISAVNETVTGTAAVNVILGPLDHITINPNPATIVVGESQQFSGAAYDIYNNQIPGVEFTWISNIGSVNSTGYFTAQTTPGTGFVNAVNNTITGIANVEVIVGDIDHIMITPDSASITVGGSLQFTAEPEDIYNNRILYVDFVWNTNVGSVNSTGYFTAQTVPGSGWITATNSTVSGSATIDVSAGPVDNIIVTPDPTTVLAGDTQQFTATAYDAFNNMIPEIEFTWSTNIGVVNLTGYFTAQTVPGTGFLNANNASIDGTAVVNVVAGPINNIIVTPDPTTVAVGDGQQFTAVAYDVYNNIIPEVKFNWNTNMGTVDSTGFFTAQTMPANGWVSATNGSITGFAAVNVISGPLDHITIEPDSADVIAGDNQQFIATAYDIYNNVISGVDFTWNTNAGIIDSNGLLTAQTTPTIGIVTASNSTVVSSTLVNIVIGPVDHIIVIPGSVTITVDSTKQFSASAYDAYNNLIPDVDFVWSTNMGSVNSTGYFTAQTAAGTGHVSAASGTVTGSAIMQVAAGNVHHITITPNPAAIVVVGIQQFTATAYDIYNNEIIGAGLTWNTDVGSIDSNGLFTAQSTSGTGIVSATSGTITGYANIEVIVGVTIDHIIVTPNPAVVFIDESRQFTATAYDSLNNVMLGIGFDWITDVGSVDSTGYFTAQIAPGNGHVSATNDSVTGSATVSIIEHTFNIDLISGWNLISIPLIQTNTSIPNVLSSIDGKWDSVKYYDQTDMNDPWKGYSPAKPLGMNDLQNIDHKIGVWIHTTEACTMAVNGSLPASTSIPLYAGWNLVSYPSQTSRLASNTLSGTGADMISIHNGASPYFIEDKTDLSTAEMTSGEGYWVHVPADAVWIVDW